MAFSADTEWDELEIESMASISWEEGLEEIDSFFNSSPDGRNSTIGEQANDPTPDNINAPPREDAAANASSAEQTQEDASPDDDEDAPHELEEPISAGADEFASLMRDLDQVTAGEKSPTNPKGRINFILNERNSPASEAAPPTSVSNTDYPVPGNVDIGGVAQSPSAEVRQASTLKKHEPEHASTEAVAAAANTLSDTNTLQDLPQQQSDSRSDIGSVPLASLHAEKGLALLSPRHGRPTDLPPSHASKSPPKTTKGSLPPLLPILPKEENLLPATIPAEAVLPATKASEAGPLHELPQPQPDSQSEVSSAPLASFGVEKGLSLLSPRRGWPVELPTASGTKSPTKSPVQSQPSLPSDEDLLPVTPGQDSTGGAIMPDDPGLPPRSPVMPSSGGKSSLLDEMRTEEEGSAGLMISAAGSMVQPDLGAGARQDRKDSGPTLGFRDIIAEAETAQQKAQAFMTTAQEELKPLPDVREQNVIEQANFAQQKARTVMSTIQDEAKQSSSDLSDITDVERTDENSEAVGSAHANQELDSTPNKNAKTKAPATKATKVTKDTRATKAMKKAVEKKEQARPTPQRRSARNQPTVQYDEGSQAETQEELVAKASAEQTVPAKRKAKASPAPQNKRAKKDAKSTTESSEGSATTKSKPAKAADTVLSNTRPNKTHPVGRNEPKNLKWAFDNPQDVDISEKRKTRGQKQEQEKMLPNPGLAAKERHKRKSA